MLPNQLPLQDMANYILDQFCQNNYNEKCSLSILNLSKTEVRGESCLHTLYFNIKRHYRYQDDDDALDLQCDALDRAYSDAITWGISFLSDLIKDFPTSFSLEETKDGESTMLKIAQSQFPGQTIYTTWLHIVPTDQSLIITLIDYPQ